MFKRFSSILLPFLILGLTACNPKTETDAIKIGAIFGLTSFPEYTVPASQAVQMAVEEANAQGGVLGRPVELIIRDDKGKPGEAVLEAENLFLRDKVVALTGTTYTHIAFALSEFSRKNHAPAFLTFGSSNEITWKNGHPYTFIMEMAPLVAAKAQAELLSKLPVKRWATVAPDYEYGRSAVASFKEEMKRLRPEVEFVAELWSPIGKFQPGPQVSALAQAKPEAVFNALLTSDMVKYVRETRKRGLDHLLTFHNTLGAPEEWEGLKGEIPDGWYVMGYPRGEITTPEHIAFLQNFKEKFGREPNMSALWNYVGVKFLLAAIARAGSTEADKIVAAAEGLTIKTPLGPVSLRASDHRSTLGYFLGRLRMKEGQVSITDWTQIDVNKYSPSDEWIRDQRRAGR